MGPKKGTEYVESLKKMNPEIYAKGEKISNFWEHPLLISSIQSWGTQTYDAAFDPKTKDLLTVNGFDGEKTHSYWNFPSTRKHLLDEYLATFEIAKRSPMTGYVTIPRDCLVGVLIAAYKADKKYGTSYFKKALDYCKHFQKNQLLGAAAVTDVKGDRSLRPGQQKDPDMYVRVVEKRKDGIIVRGAKAHQTGGAVANELVFIPQRAMRKEDKDYAVSFALPMDWKGIKLVLRAGGKPGKELETPVSGRDDCADTFTVLEDVFVPNERVFLCGEWEFAADAAYNFSTINRTPWCADAAGAFYMWIGAAALIADYNGVPNAPHIRDKIFQMISYMTTEYSLGLMAIHQSKNINLGEISLEMPDPIPTNIGKHFGLDSWFQMSRLMQDVAGGAVSTLPFAEDIETPPQSEWIKKYFRGVENVSTLDRFKVFKLIRDVTCSEYAGWWYSAIVNGSGSPAAERITALREFDLESAKRNVKAILKIE